MTTNDTSKFSHNSASSDESGAAFDLAASNLESVLDGYDGYAKAAFAEFDADDVSPQMRAAQLELIRAGGEVRDIIKQLRGAIHDSSDVAVHTNQRAGSFWK